MFIVLALTLRGPLGHVGISFAVTGASGVQMLLLWYLMRRHLPHLHLAEVAGSALRTLLAVAGASAAGLAVAATLAPLLTGNWVVRLVPGLGSATAFGCTFLVAAWLLKSPELSTVATPLLRRLPLGRRR
ncbi:MAG: hypothetical protein JJ992_02715 [Planctomycetes bacterium]|nr:hypothetical protein [Planctomycetota bacterium]